MMAAMKRPPDKFIQEYETFRERWRWAQRGIDDNDLVAAQSAHAGMTDFLDRWQATWEYRNSRKRWPACGRTPT